MIVYVDGNGSPYLTSTVDRVSSIPTTSAEPTVTSTSIAVEPTSSSAEPSLAAVQNVEPTASSAPPPPPPHAPEPTSSTPPPPSPPPSPPATSAAPASSSQPPPAPPAPSPTVQALEAPEPKPYVASTDSFPLGITYDPYKGTSDNVNCKTSDEIAADFKTMQDYGIVRIYGNDCGQIPVAVRAAKLNGQKLMGGIYAPLQVHSYDSNYDAPV